MDLMPENPVVQEKKSSKFTIWLIIVVVLMIILIIAAVGIWMYSKNLKTSEFKVILDGTKSTSLAKDGKTFLLSDGKVYTSIEDIAGQIAYSYYSGEYMQFNEDKTKCYVTNQKEICTFASGSKEIVKYVVEGEDDLAQTFEIDEEVQMKGNKLYISQDGLSRAFNLLTSYDENNNTFNISTLPYLTSYYEKKVEGASLEKSDFQDNIKFNNEKALLRGLVVVQDEKTKLYGVVSYKDSKTENKITVRYRQVEYMEGTDDFIVTTSENKVGIIGSDGITKVKPSYNEINVIDKNLGLYLATEDSKPSVINGKGKIIVYPDYDSIGLDSNSYTDPNVTNRFLLFGNCIPVRLNRKWGIINVNGDTLLDVVYDGIGYSDDVNTGQKNTNGVVIIPEMKGIVIEVDNEDQNTGAIIKKYGIIDATTGKLMTNIVLDSAYSTTTANETTYYVTTQDRVLDIVNWWHDQMAKQGNNNNNIENNNSTTDDQTATNNNEQNSNGQKNLEVNEEILNSQENAENNGQTSNEQTNSEDNGEQNGQNPNAQEQ